MSPKGRKQKVLKNICIHAVCFGRRTVTDCMNTRDYKTEADELLKRVVHLEQVSSDTAKREGFILDGLRRAQLAQEEDKVFLSGYAMGVLILNISALGQEKASRFIAGCNGWKSHTNHVLSVLDGEKGEIRLNKAGTCWVIDLASPHSTTMFAWTSGPRQMRFSGPRLNTTNGGAHWCGLVSETLSLHPEKSKHTLAFLQKAKETFAVHGMTPMQWNRHQDELEMARRTRANEVVQAAVEAGKRDGVVVSLGNWLSPSLGVVYLEAAEHIAGTEGSLPADLADQVHASVAAKRQVEEEAKIMAELEAEATRLAEEKAKAEADATRRSEVAVASKMAGVSPEAWEALSPKQQRLALHRARLSGRI